MTLNNSTLFLDACFLAVTVASKPLLLVMSCFRFLFKIGSDESSLSQKEGIPHRAEAENLWVRQLGAGVGGWGGEMLAGNVPALRRLRQEVEI